ncbi:RidA family protein [Nocardiopsis metallicus]|uniref:2-iminobutanoate/2-iminopropanoate deaminase n=1 Tax=Nocardiopsis metallicus TaxID=179819 RepID=A0A840WPE1_9ACTN|nr:Rid family detoxifying hydrolase [Nocardiopsis metallicus]MBB5493477.1 2-iminobutanoate/2-iminopropanoate deaminase [Nocardiopsis metallicus]
MSKKAVQTDKAPAPAGAYSQGVVAGGFLYTAGFGPQDPETGRVAPTVGEQTTQVLANIAAVLAEHDLTLDDIVKSTVHLENLKADFPEFNAVYEQHFTAPYPVRTTVGSDLANILVEIDVVAKLRD